MPTSTRALFVLYAMLLGGSAFGDTAALAQGFAGDRVQIFHGKPLRPIPFERAPIVVGPAPRAVPGFGLACLTRQVQVCCPKYWGCHPACHMEAKCIPVRNRVEIR